MSMEDIFSIKDGRELLLAVGAAGDDKVTQFFETVSQAKSISFWTTVNSAVAGAIKSLQVVAENIDENLNILSAAAKCVKAALSLAAFKPSQIKSILIDLNQFQGDFEDESAPVLSLKNLISSICEACIMANDTGSELYLPSTLTFLLRESLRPDGKDNALKRLLTLRHGFEALDFSNTDKGLIKELLLRCFIHPNYLKSAEARKFLAELMAMSEGFLCDAVCKVMKVQIASGSAVLATQYGGILYKVWKDNVGRASVFVKKLQENIQNLVHESIHADSGKRFKGLKQLLKTFHDVTRSDNFNTMLVEIFDPIIWRSLRCANAIVRSQAAVVFLDVFPLQNMSPSPEESDRLLQKQFDQLISLLKDDDQRVRSIAITGVCHILREYWDILPPATIQNLLKYIFETLAFDVSSANVRHAVVMGMQDLLQQPLSHKALKGLLPILKNYINDHSERVRVSFVQLLNMVKNVQEIVFYDIVPVDYLSARLAEDRNDEGLCNAMTELLVNSYFPQNTTDKLEKINRCIQFLNDNALAAEAFYRHLYKHSSVGSVSKLAAMLFTLLLSSPPKAQPSAVAAEASKKVKRQRNGNTKAPALVAVLDEEATESNESTLVQDVPCFLKVLKVTSTILQSIQHLLKDNVASLDLINKYITVKGLKQLLSITMIQPTHSEYLISGALQLISTVARFQSNVTESFDLQFLLHAVYLNKIQTMGDSYSSRVLTSSFVDISITMGYEVSLLDELTEAISTTNAHLRKKAKESPIKLSIVASLVLNMVERKCKEVAVDNPVKVHNKFMKLWEHVKGTLTIFLAPKKKESIAISEGDYESCMLLHKALTTYAVFLDSKSALATLVQSDLAPTQYLQEMVEYLRVSFPTNMKFSSEQMLFLYDMLTSTMLILLDSIELLPKPLFITAELVHYVGFVNEVLAINETGKVADTFRRKCMIVCDRISQQLSKMKWSDGEELKQLTSSMEVFVNSVAGYVSEEESAMHSMYQRCLKVIGKKGDKSVEKGAAGKDERLSKITNVVSDENVQRN